MLFRNAATEERIKESKTRGLKMPDLEMRFFFIGIFAIRQEKMRRENRDETLWRESGFSFFVETGLVNCINCNPVPRGTRNHPHEAL